MTVTIEVDKDDFIATIAQAMKYVALVNEGVKEWSHYYDALSNIYPDPVEDYEGGYEEIARSIVEEMICQ